MEGSKVLFYNYKIEPEIALKISNQLIISSKEKRTDSFVAPYYDGVHIYIFFKDDREPTRVIKIVPEDGTSVFVKMDVKPRSGGSVESWVWSVESSWLSQFMEKVKKDTEL